MLKHSRGASRGGRAARRWAALAVVAFGFATLGACDDDYYQETTGPERYGYGYYLYEAFPLYGCWSRVDAGGTGFLDETAWIFRSDFKGSRTIIRRSLSGVPLGSEIASFDWTPVVSGQVRIVFTGGPVGGTTILQLPYTIETSFGSPALHLGGHIFVRGCS